MLHSTTLMPTFLEPRLGGKSYAAYIRCGKRILLWWALFTVQCSRLLPACQISVRTSDSVCVQYYSWLASWYPKKISGNGTILDVEVLVWNESVHKCDQRDRIRQGARNLQTWHFQKWTKFRWENVQLVPVGSSLFDLLTALGFLSYNHSWSHESSEKCKFKAGNAAVISFWLGGTRCILSSLSQLNFKPWASW